MNKTLIVVGLALLGMALVARTASAVTPRPRPNPPVVIITPDPNPQPLQSPQ